MEEGLRITPELIEEYLQARQADGLTEKTIQSYRWRLFKAYSLLPEEDKTIYRGTIRSLGEGYRERGFSVQATNGLLSALDNLVFWCQHPELQACERLEKESVIQPEITRAEYLRLLSAAKMLGKERDYLIIKIIALTGVSVSELISMTVENVERGWVKCGEELHRIPTALKQELLSYVKRNGIHNGPLFPGNSKGSLHRSRVTTTINSLAVPAHVDEGKCNPRCLRRLYQETQSQLREMAQALVDQSQERMIESEQRVYGWGA